MDSINLSGANLSKVVLGYANLIEANLSEANLSEADLIGATLTSAILSGADLSMAKCISAVFADANFSKTNLNGVNFNFANLSKVNLHGANLSGAFLNGANLMGTDLSEANLTAAELRAANVSYANLNGANLTRCKVHAISAWNVSLENTVQSELIITRGGEATVTVDDLEIAQFIYLLLNHKKLRNVINSVTGRGVLLLGRFGGGGLDVLKAIAAKLRAENYLPIIFDFERPQDRDYTETVTTLAGLARFVIVDLSGPSVPQELSHIVPFFDIPFVPILEKGRNSYSMFVDLFKYSWVLRPIIEFANVEELLERMPTQVIAPAEEKHQARQKLLDELFPPS